MVYSPNDLIDLVIDRYPMVLNELQCTPYLTPPAPHSPWHHGRSRPMSHQWPHEFLNPKAADVGCLIHRFVGRAFRVHDHSFSKCDRPHESALIPSPHDQRLNRFHSVVTPPYKPARLLLSHRDDPHQTQSHRQVLQGLGFVIRPAHY